MTASIIDGMILVGLFSRGSSAAMSSRASRSEA